MTEKQTIIRRCKGEKLYSLVYKMELNDQEIEQKTSFIIKVIENQFKFEIERNMLVLGMPPYVKFREKDGIELWVAIDDFDGLSIDSNSYEILEKLQPYLE